MWDVFFVWMHICKIYTYYISTYTQKNVWSHWKVDSRILSELPGVGWRGGKQVDIGQGVKSLHKISSGDLVYSHGAVVNSTVFLTWNLVS